MRALVLGSTGGIGAALCRVLNQHGYQVTVTSNWTLVPQWGESSVTELISYLRIEPPFDLVFNAIGYNGAPAPAHLIQSQSLSDALFINAVAPMLISRALIANRLMGLGSRIVHFTSPRTNASLQHVHDPAFTMSKCALEAGIRSLAAYAASNDCCLLLHGPTSVATRGSGGVGSDPDVYVQAMLNQILSQSYPSGTSFYR